MPKYNRLDSFPSDDGHIESILIGCEDAKVSFQTWNGKALTIIFRDVDKITSNHSVYGDIGDFVCSDLKGDYKRYSFKDASTDEIVLDIDSKSMEIYDTGFAKDINGAIFDVGYDYIGNQKCPYYDL
ncbi:MAG: hypothetical protein IJ716_06355 [Lachnospiraceae bacterium]|nr:hypothetical protein [Lachnospiraceae bacterium]